MPAATRAATLVLISSVRRSARALPSMMRAVMGWSSPQRRGISGVVSRPREFYPIQCRAWVPRDVLAALHARLARELAPPRARYRPLYVDRRRRGLARRCARASGSRRLRDTFDVRDRAHRLSSPGSTTRRREPRRWTGSRASSPPTARSPRGATSATTVAPNSARRRGSSSSAPPRATSACSTYAAHVNGLVRRGDDVAMWIARRSPTKSIDPGMLDNLVGGGIAAGQSVASTVIKEAFEEAGIEAPLAARALAQGTVRICREQPDGLQRETIFVHDLWLPRGFVPSCRDGEVVEHRLVRCRGSPRSSRRTTGPTSSPPMRASSSSIACCATARSRPRRAAALQPSRLLELQASTTGVGMLVPDPETRVLATIWPGVALRCWWRPTAAHRTHSATGRRPDSTAISTRSLRAAGRS